MCRTLRERLPNKRNMTEVSGANLSSGVSFLVAHNQELLDCVKALQKSGEIDDVTKERYDRVADSIRLKKGDSVTTTDLSFVTLVGRAPHPIYKFTPEGR